jgi:hypothetical protein
VEGSSVSTTSVGSEIIAEEVEVVSMDDTVEVVSTGSTGAGVGVGVGSRVGVGVGSS